MLSAVKDRILISPQVWRKRLLFPNSQWRDIDKFLIKDDYHLNAIFKLGLNPLDGRSLFIKGLDWSSQLLDVRKNGGYVAIGIGFAYVLVCVTASLLENLYKLWRIVVVSLVRCCQSITAGMATIVKHSIVEILFT